MSTLTLSDPPNGTTDPAQRLRRIAALAEASRSTAKESVRYGLSRLRLRGSTGEVVATDGKQLLVQGNFQFPWQDAVLVPRLSVFGHRDMAIPGTVPLVVRRTR
jgi:hypothetical protein